MPRLLEVSRRAEHKGCSDLTFSPDSMLLLPPTLHLPKRALTKLSPLFRNTRLQLPAHLLSPLDHDLLHNMSMNLETSQQHLNPTQTLNLMNLDVRLRLSPDYWHRLQATISLKESGTAQMQNTICWLRINPLTIAQRDATTRLDANILPSQ